MLVGVWDDCEAWDCAPSDRLERYHLPDWPTGLSYEGVEEFLELAKTEGVRVDGTLLSMMELEDSFHEEEIDVEKEEEEREKEYEEEELERIEQEEY